MKDFSFLSYVIRILPYVTRHVFVCLAVFVLCVVSIINVFVFYLCRCFLVGVFSFVAFFFNVFIYILLNFVCCLIILF